VFEVSLSLADTPLLRDHCCGDVAIVSGACLVAMTIEAAGRDCGPCVWTLEDVAFTEPLALLAGEERIGQVIFSTGDGSDQLFKVVSRSAGDDSSDAWSIHAKGSIARGRVSETATDESPRPWREFSQRPLSQQQAKAVAGDSVYEAMRRHRIQIGPSLRLIHDAKVAENEALCRIALPTTSDGLAAFPLHPALLDACLHAAGGVHDYDLGQTLVPVGVDRLRFFGGPTKDSLWCYLRFHPESAMTLSVDVCLFEDGGGPIVQFEGVHYHRVPTGDFLGGLGSSAPSEGGGREPQRELLARLRESPAVERRKILVDFMAEAVRGLLCLDPAKPLDLDQGFMAAGLDSLQVMRLSAQLQDALGCALPTTIAMKYPTVHTLADYLLTEVVGMRLQPTPDLRPDSSGAGHRPQTRPEPIAVVGMGCRFPGGCNTPEDFWRLLHEGEDAVTEIPPARWNVRDYFSADRDTPGKVYAQRAALLSQDIVEEFSADFFGIAPREVERMDPQQRMFLEVCWEGLEDAGQAVDRRQGMRAGVFVGSCTDDYLQLSNNLADLPSIDAYSSLGTSRSIIAGRVSYLLGFDGPSIHLDTACSSSLVAVHLACQSLRSGECDLALAGAVNLQLGPVWTVGLCRLGALSPEGRSRAFDAKADGFVRGEGCGVVVLKRLSDALADRDTIRALLIGTAVNHDGRSSGLTVPNEQAQERLLRQALEFAQVGPEAIDYIEAHGTGTPLGDPIEMGAIGTVFGQRREPLWVGSVKTNVGHLEAAAGIAGLIKVVLALEQETIPPHLHFREPSPHIPWERLPVKIPIECIRWPRGARPRRAGVSAFGFSGANAHVVVEEAPRVAQNSTESGAPHLVLLSARSPEALRQLAATYAAHLAAHSEARLADVSRTTWLGRAHFDHRAAVLAGTIEEARASLGALARMSEASGVLLGARDADGCAAVAPAVVNAGQSPAPERLAQLADSYLAGEDVDWQTAAEELGIGGRKVPLPTYPFQRQRYWAKKRVTEAFDHPTPGARPGFAPGQSRLAPTRAAAQPVADRSGELDASRLASMSDEEVELLLKQQELLLRGQSKNE
jgi:acyl transferase domain-containing protein